MRDLAILLSNAPPKAYSALLPHTCNGTPIYTTHPARLRSRRMTQTARVVHDASSNRMHRASHVRKLPLGHGLRGLQAAAYLLPNILDKEARSLQSFARTTPRFLPARSSSIMPLTPLLQHRGTQTPPRSNSSHRILPVASGEVVHMQGYLRREVSAGRR